MSQKSLEIVGEEWIASSLVESEYSGLILQEDSIVAVDSIESEDYLVPVIFHESEDFIGSEEIIGSGSEEFIGSGSEEIIGSGSEEFIGSGSEEFIGSGSEEFIGSGSEEIIGSEGFLVSESSPDSEYPRTSEDALALEYSEVIGNPIFLQETNSEDSLASINPTFLQGTTNFDPLTGIANNAKSTNIFSGSRVNTLSQAGLSINLSTGIPNYATVTTTVKVELSPLVKLLIYFDVVDFTLQSNVWGIDGPGWFQGGADDYLFGFSDQKITGDGTYSFSSTVPRNWLNEDNQWFLNRDDEIQGRFKLASSDNAFPLNLEARSGIIRGYF